MILSYMKNVLLIIIVSTLILILATLLLSLWAPPSLAFPSGEPFQERDEPWSVKAVEEAADTWASWVSCPEGSTGMTIDNHGIDNPDGTSPEAGQCVPSEWEAQ